MQEYQVPEYQEILYNIRLVITRGINISLEWSDRISVRSWRPEHVSGDRFGSGFIRHFHWRKGGAHTYYVILLLCLFSGGNANEFHLTFPYGLFQKFQSCVRWIKLINELERRWWKAAAVYHSRLEGRNCNVHRYPFRMQCPLISTAVIATDTFMPVSSAQCSVINCNGGFSGFQALYRCHIEMFCVHTTKVMWSKGRFVLAINCVHTERPSRVSCGHFVCRLLGKSSEINVTHSCGVVPA